MNKNYLVKNLICLVSLLMACATASPTEYKQGVYTPARAPTFNPVEDAPHTVGQPGYVGRPESLPRSPNKRILPQTPETRQEPGLWAGDEPMASLSNQREPKILGLIAPFPPKMNFALKFEIAAKCNQLFVDPVKPTLLLRVF
jgi:hypothetical protein